MSLKQEEKHEFLLGLDSEAKNYKETRKPEDPGIHYYSMIKQLTLWGYFSSWIYRSIVRHDSATKVATDSGAKFSTVPLQRWPLIPLQSTPVDYRICS